jgi:hypothetical protein
MDGDREELCSLNCVAEPVVDEWNVLMWKCDCEPQLQFVENPMGIFMSLTAFGWQDNVPGSSGEGLAVRTVWTDVRDEGLDKERGREGEAVSDDADMKNGVLNLSDSRE